MERAKSADRKEAERLKFIEHKGKKILYVDFSDCTAEEVLRVIEECKEVMITEQKHSILLLANARNAHFNLQTVDALKDFMRLAMRYINKGAGVGLEGLQVLVYDTVTAFYKSSLPSVDDIKETREKFRRFDDTEKAEDWLVED